MLNKITTDDEKPSDCMHCAYCSSANDLGIGTLQGAAAVVKPAEGQIPFCSLVQAIRSVQITMSELSCTRGTCCLPHKQTSSVKCCIDGLA